MHVANCQIPYHKESDMCKLLYGLCVCTEGLSTSFSECKARGLSPFNTHNHRITALLHQHACEYLHLRCLMQNIGISLKGAISCNKVSDI